MLKKGVLIILINFFSSILFSQDSIPEQGKNIEFSGYISDVQGVYFDAISHPWVTSQLLHNRLNFSIYLLKNHLKINTSIRNRFYWADNLNTNTLLLNSGSDKTGWIKANYNLAQGTSFRLNTEFDRFYTTLESNRFVLSLGRQRINWAHTFIWNPNDLFNAYAFFDIDYIERPGCDAIRLQYYNSETSITEMALKINHNKQITAAFLYRFNSYGYDFQLLGGIIDQTDYVMGLGFSGNIANKISLRGELDFLTPKNAIRWKKFSTLASFEVDYTFPFSLTLMGEYFYNSFASKQFDINSFQSYLVSTANIKTLSPARHNFATQISYPLTSLLTSNLAIVYMPSMDGYYLAPSFTYSLADNLDFNFAAQSFSFLLNQTKVYFHYILLRIKLYW